jgi:hypothetical protein
MRASSSFPHPSAGTPLVVRKRQWVYLGPILAAPLAHIAVSVYRHASTKRQQQVILGVGIVGSTILTLWMRLYLMHHAGLPGVDMDERVKRERILKISEDAKKQIESPSMLTVLKEAARGFG